jgi:hypothetical protein
VLIPGSTASQISWIGSVQGYFSPGISDTRVLVTTSRRNNREIFRCGVPETHHYNRMDPPRFYNMHDLPLEQMVPNIPVCPLHTVLTRRSQGIGAGFAVGMYPLAIDI